MKPTDPDKTDAVKTINPIVRFAVERRVTMTMIVLGILVLGWISLERLPLEFLPSFSSDSVSVSADYRSSSPEEIERLIVRPLEDSLGTINGIDTLSASASASSANINITFIDGLDMEMAVVEVRDRIDRVRHLLPDDLDQVRIRRFQSTDIPVLSFHLSADWEDDKLYDYAETVVQRRLERLSGVAQVSVRGIRTPELQIRLDPQRLEAHGVDVRALSSSLRGANVNMSGGDLREGNRKFIVRTVGEFESPAEIRSLPIGQGALRLGDVAEVLYTFPRQESYNFLNGTSALTVSVNKASTANLLAVVDSVQAEIEALRGLPESQGAVMRIYRDSSIDVRQGIGQLRQTGFVGAGLAVLAVFLFLRRFRTTALVAIAIPVSVVFTFVILYLLRQAGVIDTTLNVISLTGLMLALGMLVDNSIVVIESIFRHRNELGEDAKTAALRGTSAVAMPIIASTATTLCVFVPLVFTMSGGYARYLKDIGITISIVSVAALLIALTVVPMAAVLLLKDQKERPSPMLDRFYRSYASLLQFTLRYRLVVVGLAIAMLVGSYQIFAGIERTFSSGKVERQVTLRIDTPRQYSLEQTKSLYDELYTLLDKNRESLEIADISHRYDRGTGRARSPWRGGRRFEIFLKDEAESKLSTTEIQNKIRQMLPVKAGVELKIAQARHHGGGSSGVTLELMGDDQSVLELLAGQVSSRLTALPMIRDVDTSLEDGDEEIHIQVERGRASQMGLSSQAVAFSVNNALSSRAMSHYKTESREIDIVMQYAEEDRETLEQLKKVPVFSGAGRETALPLSALAGFEKVAGPKSIQRENRLSKVTITANAINARSSFMAMGAARQIMGEMAMPPGYSWSFGRWTRHQAQDQGSAIFTFIFALVLIYMLMAALFESFSQPFTIMFAVPFAFIGVGIVMKLANQPRDNMTNIGFLILVGVVVNNAIVLIDHINNLRREGMSVHDAIVLGGQHRFRPIVITAVTTILGLMPMVAPFFLPQFFGTVEGRAGQWAPVGLIIVGGLTTSTFLTLMIIPTIYSLVDDIENFFRRVARAVVYGGTRRRTSPSPAPTADLAVDLS